MNLGKILAKYSKHKQGLMGDIILRNALFYPNNEAYVFGDQRVTFHQYNTRINKIINALSRKGLRKGDILGVLSWNCIEYMDIFGAADKAGFVIVPYNARLSKNEIVYLINDSEAAVLFVGPEFVDLVEEIKNRLYRVRQFVSFDNSTPDMDTYVNFVSGNARDDPDIEINDDDPLFICYTSGTTGLPRGALYTHGLFRESVIGHSLDVPMDVGDRILGLTPPFHIARIMSRGYSLYQVATNVVMKKFDPRYVMEIIDNEKITDISLVPTQLAMLLDFPDFNEFNISSIKRVNYMGSPMPLELLRRGMKIFGPVFCQGYGQTESGPDITFLKERDHTLINRSTKYRSKLLSCGRPAIGVHVRIVDDKCIDMNPGEIGEIIVKSRHVMKEYWKKPEETKQTIVKGWLYTRDLGYYDSQGYIYLVDRKQDMIVSGGENIYPREVEEVLYKHPAILECAVFGIPDPKWIEAVHAVVSLKKGMNSNAQELIDFCKNNMAKYKTPKTIDIFEELPKNSAGKILKKELRQQYLKL